MTDNAPALVGEFDTPCNALSAKERAMRAIAISRVSSALMPSTWTSR
jgi:hypothetical protein